MATALESMANGVKHSVTETIREVRRFSTTPSHHFKPILTIKHSYFSSVHWLVGGGQARMHTRNIAIKAIHSNHTEDLPRVDSRSLFSSIPQVRTYNEKKNIDHSRKSKCWQKQIFTWLPCFDEPSQKNIVKVNVSTDERLELNLNRPGWAVRYMVGPFDANWLEYLITDVCAGITVALTLIPQGKEPKIYSIIFYSVESHSTWSVNNYIFSTHVKRHCIASHHMAFSSSSIILYSIHVNTTHHLCLNNLFSSLPFPFPSPILSAVLCGTSKLPSCAWPLRCHHTLCLLLILRNIHAGTHADALSVVRNVLWGMFFHIVVIMMGIILSFPSIVRVILIVAFCRCICLLASDRV